MASLAGSWIALVAGLAGLRDDGVTLSFAPRLPEELSRLALKISLRRRRLAIVVRAATATYTLLEGEPIGIAHHGEAITASLDEPIVRPIPPAPTPASTAQPPGREPLRRRPRDQVEGGTGCARS